MSSEVALRPLYSPDICFLSCFLHFRSTYFMKMGQPSPIGSISSLTNKIALITGASSGLGRAIAEAYAAAGAYVVSADLKPEPQQQPNIAQILKDSDLTTPTADLLNVKWPSEKNGLRRAEYVKCDVTDEESVKDAVAFTVEKYGRLDIMVNNAATILKPNPGIGAEINKNLNPSGVRRRIHETPLAIFDATHAVNARGVWLGCKYALAQFLSQEPSPEFSRTATGATSDVHRGWIINLGSILSVSGYPFFSSYCASKGGVLQITRTAALEYAKDGIHVNAILPGFADTHILEGMYANAEGGKESVVNAL
ncbi:hypothetical protein CLAIMM_12056 [Cladophialophora immunda]|nr:hypothetical protein CLAIMM_12056 [Cladophialophora immunda]